MQKVNYSKWKKVNLRKGSNNLPSPRWGHTCCVIEDEIIFFGGYADSNYMNDLWAFNITNNQWKQIKTKGNIPQNRSNCTMNYDSENNKIIIFGGGGPNKKRFNSLHILDWNTKQWSEIIPKQNQSAPWERTYHSAQFLFPYLIVFGGEGIADLDDLWIYNFLTANWQQIIIEKNKVKPCARRFHCSALIKNEVFIIGGCYSKYRSLNDVYSLDLTPLLKNGDYASLEWKQRKLEGNTFLTRWGHTSCVFGEKIYVFGGRFSNDLNDLLVIDIQNNIIKTVRGSLEAPKARRRHCAAFIGSTLVIFGGFNGQYFNDLYYINLQDNRNNIPKSQILSKLSSLVNNPLHSDRKIVGIDGLEIFIHQQLVFRSFENKTAAEQFLTYLSKLTIEKIISLLRFVYTRVGEIDKEIYSKYMMKGAANEKVEFRNYYNVVKNEVKDQWIVSNTLSIPNQVTNVIKLQKQQWQSLFNSYQFNKQAFKINDNIITAKKSLLSVNSSYFYDLLSRDFLEEQIIQIQDIPDKIFKVIVKYLEFDIILYPDGFTLSDWMQLIAVAKYYQLQRFIVLCEYQIMQNLQSSQQTEITKIFTFAVKHKLENLKNFCAEFEVRKIYKSTVTLNFNYFDKMEYKNRTQYQIISMRKKQLKLIYFQLQQARLQNVNKAIMVKKESFLNDEYQKENSEINS